MYIAAASALGVLVQVERVDEECAFLEGWYNPAACDDDRLAAMTPGESSVRTPVAEDCMPLFPADRLGRMAASAAPDEEGYAKCGGE